MYSYLSRIFIICKPWMICLYMGSAPGVYQPLLYGAYHSTNHKQWYYTGKQFCDTVLSGSIQPNVDVSWLVDMTRLLAIVHETFSCLSGDVRNQLYKGVLKDKKIISGASKRYLYWDFLSCRFMLPFVLPNNDHSPPVLSRLEKGSSILVGPKRSGIKSLL